jgi:tripartite-type tricarboxylate transporter receptor subunit TctC
MKLPRRRFLHLAAGAATLPVVSRNARAQGYPTRPVRIVVPYAAGTSPDIIARLVGQALSERLGQQVIIENRTGAGGNIGTEVVVLAPADGYTLLLATGANATNAALYERLNFDFIRDIAPVAALGGVALIMVINPSFPAKTVPDFVVYAHANPGKTNMASAGSGTTVHLAAELFMEYLRDDVGPYSALMLAVRITFAHLCVSSATNFPKSEGESTRGTMPRSVYRALIAGLARPALI